MALDPLPSYTPTFGAKLESKPVVLQANFGDGYTQRAAPGLNATKQIWNLEWILTTSDANTLHNFFLTKGGHTAFTWTPPGGSSLKWVCQEWARNLAYPGYESITATFLQVFDLDT